MSITSTPGEAAALERGRQALSGGYSGQAADIARTLLAANPQLAEAHRLLGMALQNIGHLDAAETSLREAIRLAPASSPAVVALSEVLVVTDRAREAVDILAPHAARTDADIFILTAYAVALKSLRRFAEAATVYERARDVTPSSAVAEHNLAGLYGDLQRYAESLDSAQRAFAKGIDAPETWVVRARALQGLGRYDEAETAFREALRRRPGFAEAHGDLAQLIWMRTEDPKAAGQALDAALRDMPGDIALRAKKTQLNEYTGNPRLAYATLGEAPAAVRAAPLIEAHAAQLASHFDPARALGHAHRAYQAAPDQHFVAVALCQAQLAAGDPEGAARTALAMREKWPLDQHAIALLATAWRLMGVPAYRELYDYDHFVRAQPIDTPAGWSSLDAYLGDLAKALDRLHRLRTHPIGQSLRHGTQSLHGLRNSDDPVIRAFFPAIDGAIGAYLDGLGAGRDPLRGRNTGRYAFHGAWSVRLRPGGFHTDHVHQQGWISSACHIVVPERIGEGHEGWLKFGEPGVPTLPRLQAEHFIKPEPGTLVLFPSYMWHGTVPFSGEDNRLSIAFDLLPT